MELKDQKYHVERFIYVQDYSPVGCGSYAQALSKI